MHPANVVPLSRIANNFNRYLLRLETGSIFIKANNEFHRKDSVFIVAACLIPTSLEIYM